MYWNKQVTGGRGLAAGIIQKMVGFLRGVHIGHVKEPGGFVNIEVVYRTQAHLMFDG